MSEPAPPATDWEGAPPAVSAGLTICKTVPRDCENVDAGRIEATFKDGMLALDIPKTAAAKPKQIEVKVK